MYTAVSRSIQKRAHSDKCVQRLRVAIAIGQTRLPRVTMSVRATRRPEQRDLYPGGGLGVKIPRGWSWDANGLTGVVGITPEERYEVNIIYRHNI